MKRLLFSLLVAVSAFAETPLPLKVNPSTGVITEPAAATSGGFAGANGLLATTTAASTYQPLDATLTALAGVTFTTAGQVAYATGTDAFATITTTTFGRSLWDDADAATARATLGAAADDLSNIDPADLLAPLAAADEDTPLWVMDSWLIRETTKSSGLAILTSGDGVNWTPLTLSTAVSSHNSSGVSLRDMAVIYHDGWFWMCHNDLGQAGVSTYASDHFAIQKSKDRVNWTWVTDVTVPSATAVWTPKWFQDTDGTWHITVSVSTTTPYNDANPFSTYIFTPTASDFSTWGEGTQIFTGVLRPIDTWIIKEAGTYYLWYKNEATSYIEVASSSTLKGSYTVIKSGDWAGWGNNLEGTSVIKLPDGTFRLTVEQFLQPTQKLAFATSNSLLSGWSALTPFQGVDNFKHGTPRYVTDPRERKAILALSLANTRGWMTKVKNLSANYTLDPTKDDGTLFLVTTASSNITLDIQYMPMGSRFAFVKADSGSGRCYAVYGGTTYSQTYGVYNQGDRAEVLLDTSGMVFHAVPGIGSIATDPSTKKLSINRSVLVPASWAVTGAGQISFDTPTNLGIDFTTRGANGLFSIVSASTAIDAARIQNSSSSGFATFGFFDSSNNYRGSVGYANASAGGGNGGRVFVNTASSTDFAVSMNGTVSALFKSGGNVLIGTSTDSATGKLQVNGGIAATTLNGNTITTGTGTLTLGAGKTLTASNTITLTATDGSTLAIGTGGTLGTAAYTAATAYTAAPVAAPATASSTGTAGTWAYDTDYVYVCISTNTWKRAALSTWP